MSMLHIKLALLTDLAKDSFRTAKTICDIMYGVSFFNKQSEKQKKKQGKTKLKLTEQLNSWLKESLSQNKSKGIFSPLMR